MAFIRKSGVVITFATFEDVETIDSRVFEGNELSTATLTKQQVVEDMLVRSTERLVQKLKADEWWMRYTGTTVSGGLGFSPIPTPNKNLFKREADWTELCVYHTLKEYLYPKIADFGVENAAEVQKIAFYNQKFSDLWEEMMNSGDFYDRDGDGTVEKGEIEQRPQLFRRSRGYRNWNGVR